MISEKITHTLDLEKPLVDWRAEHQLVQQFFETSKVHYYFLRHMETPSPIWFEQRLKKRIPNINIWESQSFNYVITSGAYALYKFQPRSYSRNGWPHKATFRSADFNDAFSGWGGGPRSTPITGIKVPLKRNFRIWDFCIIVKFQPYLQALWSLFWSNGARKSFF